MFGIGLPELIVILGIALIVVGPEKLPQLARSLGKQMIQLKKTAEELKNSLNEEMEETDIKQGDEDPAKLPEHFEYAENVVEENQEEDDGSETEEASSETLASSDIETSGESDNQNKTDVPSS